MKLLGNLFTHYKYQKIDLKQSFSSDKNTIHSIHAQDLGSQFSISYKNNSENPSLPANSPFLDWKEARRFAGPLPHTFTYLEKKKQILIIKGNRENWTPKPIEILDYSFSFFDEMKLKNPILANAFEITNIPYQWEKGVLEQW
jgi:hypothetical protein